MGMTLDLGTRVELLSMDPYFHDISIALYRREGESGPRYLVHSYSTKEGTAERLGFLARAMEIVGGLESAGDRWLRFSCGAAHQKAARRIFLEVCKLASSAEPAARPLAVVDRKSGLTLTATPEGRGVYRVHGGDARGETARRAGAVAGGLAKLADMERAAADPERITFACGRSHDAAVGLLLVRALNVRSALEEEESAASRGVLAAPSSQR